MPEYRYKSLYNQPYSTAKAEFDADPENGYLGDPDDYRPDWTEAEATWYQVYETVSEGTPVSPPFATQAELVEYLVANGDFWDQSRRKDPSPFDPPGANAPWSKKAAENFVYGSGWAPSGLIMDGQGMRGVYYIPPTG